MSATEVIGAVFCVCFCVLDFVERVRCCYGASCYSEGLLLAASWVSVGLLLSCVISRIGGFWYFRWFGLWLRLR